MATLEIPGVDPDLAEFVQRRYKELKFNEPSEYLRSLIRADWLRATSAGENQLAALLDPIHAATAGTKLTDEEVNEAITSAREARVKRLSQSTEQRSS
jgi:Arc/MetJ-type ribon-helix-helix transcriptional regulator